MTEPSTGRALRNGLAFLAVAAICACTADPRTKANEDGTVPFAPVTNTLDAEPALAAPSSISGIPRPDRGLIETSMSFGATSTYMVDARTGIFTGVWSDPDFSGSGANPPMVQSHHARLSKAEQTGLIKLANRAWAPRHATPNIAGTPDSGMTVWLLDGTHFKAIDGNGAGAPIAASLLALAHTHGVVRDDHER